MVLVNTMPSLVLAFVLCATTYSPFLASAVKPVDLSGQQIQALLLGIQQNPALIQQLRGNPILIKSLQNKLAQQNAAAAAAAAPPHRGQLRAVTSPFATRGRFGAPVNLQHQHLQQQQQQQQQQLLQQQDQCLSLRKQNARLRQMILAVTNDEGLLAGDPFQQQTLARNSNPHHQVLGRRDQRELNPSHRLLNQAFVPKLAKLVPTATTSLESVLITPTPIWTTEVSTSSYLTTITTSLATEVPIIWRGSKIITTIIEPETQTVTATEVKTSSTLVTPTPTWETRIVTITPTQVVPQSLPSAPVALGASLWPAQVLPRPVDPRTGLEQADVLEIGQKTSTTLAKTQLDRLKQAYGIYFANSANRSAKRFFGNRQKQPQQQQTSRPRNPLFLGAPSGVDLDYEEDFYADVAGDFDQQGLAAQARPVFVNKPSSRSDSKAEATTSTATSPTAPPPQAAPAPAQTPDLSTQVVTLYLSGKVPGEYTTQLTTLTVGPDGQPLSPTAKRYKREAIQPSKPQPILTTEAPSDLQLNLKQTVSSSMSECECPQFFELQGSIKTVTVTETVTVTATISADVTQP